jgi:hypothetical protein
MLYRATEGTVLSIKQELLDDLEQPVRCKPGYPKVALLDSDKQVISSIIATPSPTPGIWMANLSIPNLGIAGNSELTIRWRAIDLATNEKHTIKDSLIVEPQIDARDSDIVALFGDTKVAFVLPTTIDTADVATYQVYANNVALLTNPMDFTDASVNVDRSIIDTTRVTIPMVVPAASLYSNLLKVDILRATVSTPMVFLYKLWALTPQLMLMMSHLESFLNKSRIENTIPELRYTTGDLVTYLERGLDIFNMIEKPTTFTGLNMQGALFDAHLICAEYYAISAQLLAEGSLAFDFSGQGISLNVDRTPQLEAALGRIESLMNDKIPPLKKELIKNGITGGDGSAGATGYNNPYAKGTLGVINAATTRINTPMQRFLGRRR